MRMKAFPTLLMSVVMFLGCQQRTSPLAASTAEALALPSMERRVGQRVELEGIVSNSKYPQIQGVDVWDLDAYRGKRVRVSGVLRKTVVTQADIDALPHTSEGFPMVAHRGAGTFYSLDDMKYELLK